MAKSYYFCCIFIVISAKQFDAATVDVSSLDNEVCCDIICCH